MVELQRIAALPGGRIIPRNGLLGDEVEPGGCSIVVRARACIVDTIEHRYQSVLHIVVFDGTDLRVGKEKEAQEEIRVTPAFR